MTGIVYFRAVTSSRPPLTLERNVVAERPFTRNGPVGGTSRDASSESVLFRLFGQTSLGQPRLQRIFIDTQLAA